jgi:hypothetical protein
MLAKKYWSSVEKEVIFGFDKGTCADPLKVNKINPEIKTGKRFSDRETALCGHCRKRKPLYDIVWGHVSSAGVMKDRCNLCVEMCGTADPNGSIMQMLRGEY